jgi:hypothetical protein
MEVFLFNGTNGQSRLELPGFFTTEKCRRYTQRYIRPLYTIFLSVPSYTSVNTSFTSVVNRYYDIHKNNW